MKKDLKPFRLAYALATTLVISTANLPAAHAADDPDAPIVTGVHWTQASEEQKRAYLVGIANVLEVEQALQADKPPADTASLVPVMIRGLKDQSLLDIKAFLDRWYADHPEKRNRPVLETIWFELASPNS